MTLLLAMATFALALSISPGPVNMITFSSGVNNGVRRTLPFVLGATVGFTALLYAIGIGGEAFLNDYPLVMKGLNVLGTLFILYVGWQVMRSKGNLDQKIVKKPKFLEGVFLQWVNPKAWIASVSGVAAFVNGEGLGTILVFCTVYFVLCFVGVGFWAFSGACAQSMLSTPKRMRIFNMVMGASLCSVAIYLFLS